MNDPEVNEMIEQASHDKKAEANQAAEKRRSRIARLRHWSRKHPKRAVACIVVLFAVVLITIPATRYALVGLFVDRDIAVTVVDAQTGRPVTDAVVSIRGEQLQTDANGTAEFTALQPGKVTVSIDKKYYTTSQTITTIGARSKTYQHTVQLQATGRQIPLRVTNKISGAPIVEASVMADGTQAITDSNGDAQLVLDGSALTAEAQVSADGFNTIRTDITVSQDITANTIALTPAGKVYVVSKQSGKLDVVKLNLDGTEREVAITATGNEEVASTYIVPSNNWKFVLLHARREGNNAALYLIDTSTDKLTEIDTTNAAFDIVGWSGDRLVYTLQRNGVDDWKPGRQEIKQFDANSGALTSLDQTGGKGTSPIDYVTEYYGNMHILAGHVVYTKLWFGASPDLAKQNNALYDIDLASNNKQMVRSFGVDSIVVTRTKPDTLYVSQSGSQSEYYSYQNGRLQDAPELTPALFSAYSPAFYANEGFVVWSEPVDGKYKTYVHSAADGAVTSLVESSDWQAYGWFGSDYILMSRTESELAVLHVDSQPQLSGPQKITNYHRPPGRSQLF